MDAETPPPLTRGLTLLFAAACGIVVANIYYVQPLVGLVAPAVGLGPRGASLSVTLAQLGYAAGLLVLVPLGDRVENRRLIVLTILAAIPALAVAGLAQGPAVFLAAAACIGLTSVAVQMLVPFAAHLAPEAVRGRAVGTVMSGLLVGILLSRPIASLVASAFGWRAIFILSAVAMAGLAAVLLRKLPERRPHARHGYLALLASLLRLPAEEPALRRRAAYQAACFAAFTLFWTGVPLLLAQQFGFHQRGIAVFALIGAAGAAAAPIAGHLADRGHIRLGTACSLVLVGLSFGLAFWGGAVHAVVLLALAGVVLDCGVQANLVLAQRVIYGLGAEKRSRLNGVFMAAFFLGGAAGSAVTSLILARYGWPGICALGAVLPVLALGYFASEAGAGFTRAASTARQR